MLKGYFELKVFKAAWPIVFGYIPLGMACGILAQKVGFDWFQMLMMVKIKWRKQQKEKIKIN